MPDESRAEPGSQRHSATRQERAEQAARDEAMRDYANSPAAQELTQIKQELAEFRQWRSQLQGRGGIVVTGTIIEYRKNVNALTGGAGSSTGQLRLTLSKNGIPTDYFIDGSEA